MSDRVAVVVGGTGLVGQALLKHLADSGEYDRVVALLRREVLLPAGIEGQVIAFDQLADAFADLSPDDLYCCLGTTLKQAGSREAFRKVDLDYVIDFAEAGRRAGATRLFVVSSVGANALTRNFYLQTKGLMELTLQGLDFEALHFLRPGLLTGPRQDFRLGERVFAAISPVLDMALWGPMMDYRSIAADDVARGMIGMARTGRDGVHVHGHASIMMFAGQLR